MKFASVNGERSEAEKGMSGNCIACGNPMVAKCGEVKIWHWAHLGRRICDPWWENEGEWHRAWKGHFPEEWQEVVQLSSSGEKHIADVKTDQDWVIEFQHSFLNPEERRARNSFYTRLVWVVNGMRRKTDRAQFIRTLNASATVGINSHMRKVSTEECAILREWSGSPAPVFFDFGVSDQREKTVLWLLFPNSPDSMAYLAPFLRSEIIETYRNGATQKASDFEALLRDFPRLISNYNTGLRTLVPIQSGLQRRSQTTRKNQFPTYRSGSRRRF